MGYRKPACAQMSLKRRLHLRCVSAAFSTLPISVKWRADVKNRSVAAQVSSLLLHQKDWIRCLRSNPPLIPNPAPDVLVRRILSMTRSRPEISLQFFNWAQSNPGFFPGLRTICFLAQTLVDSNLLDEARRLLDPFLASHSPLSVVDTLARASRCRDSQSRVLNFVLESYSTSGLIAGSLESFRKFVLLGCEITVRSCNAFLHSLCLSNGVKMAWCCYASAVRNGVVADSRTWSLLSRLLCMEGKIERAVKLLGLGSCGVSAYDMVIDCYCRKGDFGAAIDLLNSMSEVNLRPRFSTYSAILDGACRFGDNGISNSMVRELMVKGFLSTVPSLDYDSIISRLCEREKSYAAKVFFDRARTRNIELASSVYGCILKAYSKEGMLLDAMELYAITLEKGIKVNVSSCNVFLNGICNGTPSREIDVVLEDAIRRGIVPNFPDLSKYIAAQCSKAQWKEADGLIDVALRNGILLDAFCFNDLVKHYFANGLVNLLMKLHDRLKKLDGCFDIYSYNLLLRALSGKGRIKEATQVFDYMLEKDSLDSESFIIMIREFCYVREMREAMNLHDKMLKLGYKPDEISYRSLISLFS